MRRLLPIAAMLVLAGCTPENNSTDPDQPGGKSDEFNNTTGAPGELPPHPMSADVIPDRDGFPDTDFCLDQGWYDDGACDLECDRHDAACPPREWLRDTLHVDLQANVTTGQSTATIVLAPEEHRGVSLRVKDLEIEEIVDGDTDQTLEYEVAEWGISAEYDHADLGDVLYVPDARESLVITYRASTAPVDGWEFGGTPLAWPTNCARLFPCNPRPEDGITFSLDIDGVPDGETAIFPTDVPADGPSYMLAWAVGDYGHAEVGTTESGTTVHVWWLDDREQAARSGTDELHLAFEWLENTLGPYTFGSDVGSIEAQWGPDGLGGMEHHPLWHVARESMSDRTTHVHEAVHGWYGDGIRIACWEDFVLSEGVTTYLTARAIEAVWGAAAGEAVWEDYAQGSYSWGNQDAWVPESCTMETVFRTDIWSLAPYRRGAFFLRALATEVGVDTLDAALGSFYRAHQNQAARFIDLLDHIEQETGFAPHEMAEEWLLGELPPLD